MITTELRQIGHPQLLGILQHFKYWLLLLLARLINRQDVVFDE